MPKKNTTLWWTLGIFAGLIILLIFARGRGRSPSGDSTEAQADDWVKGSARAGVTLIEYGDFQCPACRSYASVVKELNETFPDQLRIVYRHFPLTQIHRNALPSARAAEAAGAQGKFWEMHDLLFEKQGLWSNEGRVDEIFLDYAKSLGLDEAKFKGDYDSSMVRDRIQAHLAGANAIGLNSTPSFLLNGKKLQNPRTLADFKAVIEAAIKDAPPPILKPDDLAAAPDVHEHADFALFINGQKFDFSPAKYQSDKNDEPDHDHGSHQHDPYTHLHDKKSQIIHTHKAGVTLGYFLKTIGFEITNSCLTTDTKKQYCDDDVSSLKFFVNGKRNARPDQYEIMDLDRLLVSYGPLTDPDLTAQLKALTDEACIYSEKCPERGKPPTEQCVGGLGTDCVQ